ncbi:hypothetical protein [Kistimonas scapharcae]|uniref:hypothetical protein n=1 Tax=Kistimonas scapharcae TaxID=1036133 RepID=UPI0031EF0D6D
MSENFPVLDFDSILDLDIEVSDCLAPFSANGHEAEPQEVDSHGDLSTPAFRCETPVRAASPKLTEMSATVFHNQTGFDQECRSGESTQVAVSYEKKNENSYPCRLCSQAFYFRNALLRHLSTDHKVESTAELKLRGKRMADIPATEMREGKRVEADDPNNNVVGVNASGISLSDSGVIASTESNKSLMKSLSASDPEDCNGHTVKKHGVSLSPVMQAGDKSREQDDGYSSQMASNNSALPFTIHHSETGGLDLACPGAGIGERIHTKVTRSGSQDSGIYSLDEGDALNAESSHRRGDQAVSLASSPCPDLISNRFTRGC